MSRENVEIVRQLIEASSSGDCESVEVFVGLSDPRIEHARLPAASGPDSYSGHDGVRRWFTDMADTWREWRNEIEELVEVDPDTVVARVRFIGVGKVSGAPVEARVGFVCALSGGRIVRTGTYQSYEQAREAVGLSESGS